MAILVLALLFGIAAGMRTMTAPAVLAIGAALGRPDLSAGWAFFLSHPVSSWVLGILAAGEYAVDLLPGTPSRKVPVQFGARLVSGGLCGAVLGGTAGLVLPGLLAGIAGAVIGTLAGARARKAGADRLGRDWPVALAEDAVALGLAIFTVALLPA
ncbi:DUF4126 domain-containing protein [Teichococcus oryzae]|uniref:DUF4126 domain-containing protein n=1 Tax=Teichococcus oryzae TaxID=1608942 RepID=A0A5B2TB67_9PROT|nr:DUF4126 domain-containing protein [Pseudoroseomonas oryzae]KAA2211757.1 DUF4126 domain-containing protein [Pseudoroseomonas oryzae]